MKLNSRVTWGLAWAGLALVVAVPSADMITSQFGSKASAVVVEEASAKPASTPVKKVALVAPIPATRPSWRDSAVAAVKPAPVVAQPATQVAASSNDPVDTFMKAGKELPSYISGGADTAAVEPKATVPVAAKPAPTQVAAANPQQPLTWGESKWATPGGKDPQTTASTGPALTAPSVPPAGSVTQTASLSPQPELVAPVPMPASMRPKVAMRPTQPAIDPTTVGSFGNNDRVTARDLRDWESGPLSEFLARRQQGGQFTQRQQAYDPGADGDYVEYDASPEYLGPVESGSFFIWN